MQKGTDAAMSHFFDLNQELDRSFESITCCGGGGGGEGYPTVIGYGPGGAPYTTCGTPGTPVPRNCGCMMADGAVMVTAGVGPGAYNRGGTVGRPAVDTGTHHRLLKSNHDNKHFMLHLKIIGKGQRSQKSRLSGEPEKTLGTIQSTTSVIYSYNSIQTQSLQLYDKSSLMKQVARSGTSLVHNQDTQN